ncbi:hypothetical protein EsDP_00000698 [Epichloe bromicola]|uniref:FAD-binding domain-containing protein n=1 Tax=Epichloe bromicola TaxID=79588 RepID=A0ABQ0CFN6_9HYPO
MSVPQKCTVPVIGGGPAGSYVASALARGGIYTVVLAADRFPRHHIGESTLQSLRQGQPDAYTEFLELGGSDAYAWSLIRSESDDLLFRHAGASGAHMFDEIKVDTIHFKPYASGTSPDSNQTSDSELNPAQPVSAMSEAIAMSRPLARGTERRLVESYTRFFLAVSSATKQIRKQHELIILDMNEGDFQRAFDLFRPNTCTPIANSCH